MSNAPKPPASVRCTTRDRSVARPYPARSRMPSAPVNLRGLPRGRFTVTIKGRTRGGRTYVAHRHYRTCAAKRKRKKR